MQRQFELATVALFSLAAISAMPGVLCSGSSCGISGAVTYGPRGEYASMMILPLSQDLNYVFACNSTGFAATSYSFDYGDGTVETKRESLNYPYKWNGTGQADVAGVRVTHFFAPGTYNVSCTATDGSVSLTSSILVQAAPVTTSAGETNVRTGAYLTATPLSGSSYNLTMHTVGFTPDYLAYWEISDGTDYISGVETGDSDIVIFPHAGDWRVSVTAASFEAGYEPSYYELCTAESCEYEATICERSHLGCESPTEEIIVHVD